MMGRKIGATIGGFSRWLWSGKSKQEPVSKGLSSDEPEDTVKHPTVGGTALSKGGSVKGNGGKEMRIDKEYDAVLVPLDGDGWSDAESDELDWSIGWLESSSPEFQSDGEMDGSYAVLVPCYKPGCLELTDSVNTQLENAIKGFSYDYSAEGKKHMEQWLSSLQGR